MSLSAGDNLSFSQVEDYTIMLSIYTALRSSDYSNPLVINAEDTDVSVCTFRLQPFHITFQVFSL